jgi:FMN-dependent NADH-azoreductase
VKDMKILHINCHPDFNNNHHTTNMLMKYGLQLTKSIEDVQILNLYEKNAIPRLDNNMLSAWNKSDYSQLNEIESSIIDIQNKLIEQWISSDIILIYSPLHNFNVTSKFKDYIDNILIVRKTFKYTEEGSVGLLSNSKKVAYIQSSGSDYSIDLRYVNADISTLYARTALSFMGITELHVIKAQGLDIKGNDRAKIIEDAKENLYKFISSYIKSNL